MWDRHSAPPFLPLTPYLWPQPRALHTRCSPLLHSQQSCFIFFGGGTKRFLRATWPALEPMVGILLFNQECSDTSGWLTACHMSHVHHAVGSVIMLQHFVPNDDIVFLISRFKAQQTTATWLHFDDQKHAQPRGVLSHFLSEPTN